MCNFFLTILLHFFKKATDDFFVGSAVNDGAANDFVSVANDRNDHHEEVNDVHRPNPDQDHCVHHHAKANDDVAFSEPKLLP
jgi:hypothetical protein